MRRKIISDQFFSSELDLTSLLDVIFILLIFTMLAVQLETIRTIDLDLVEAETKEGSSMKIDSTTLKIYQGNRIDLKDSQMNLTELKSKLNTSEMQNLEWIIMVEKNVPFQDFAEVLSIIKNTHPKTIDLGVKDK